MIITLLALIVTLPGNSKKDCPDLSVKEIPMPDWQHEEDRTAITVVIQNKGKEDAKNFKVTVEDFDPKGDDYELIGDKDLVNDMKFYEEYNSEEGEGGDFDWSLEMEVEELKAGKTKELIFYLPEHWVYDPNCELKVVIDPDKSTNDCNWKNNTEYFFAWG